MNDRRELMSDYYPFFILLVLLIMEKLCQLWLQNQFNTNQETISLFERIEEQFKILKSKMQETSRDRRGSVSK